MSEKESRIAEGVEEFREEASPRPPKETKTDSWGPSRHWTTQQIYEDEYKPLPRYIKVGIKYGILFLAIFIALNHGSKHVRSTICQWGLQRHCEISP